MRLNRIVMGSRTYTYNALMAAINGGFVTFLLTVDWQVLGLTDRTALLIMIGLNAIDRVAVPMLRKVTKGPVGG